MPAVTCAYGKDEQIAIVTANSETLKPMYRLIARECGIDIEDERFIFIGAQNVPGFEQVAIGGKVDVEYVTPGIVDLCNQTLQ